MADFKKAFQLIIANEGGYVNDPDDAGGETYKGISRKNWPGWLGWIAIDHLKGLPNFPATLHDDNEIVRQLEYEVSSFYHTQFWQRISGALIQEQAVANSIFDFAVNAGTVTSVQLAQTVVKTTPDGKSGPNTVKAINDFNPDHFMSAFTVEKIRRYIAIVKKRPTSKKYFLGWISRAVGL